MSDAESCPARSFHRSRVEERTARGMEQQEPLYRLQRLAREEAANQALVNLLRRLIGLPVRKTSQDAEFEVLDQHGAPRQRATWGEPCGAREFRGHSQAEARSARRT
jgi:hypothetical protein